VKEIALRVRPWLTAYFGLALSPAGATRPASIFEAKGQTLSPTLQGTVDVGDGSPSVLPAATGPQLPHLRKHEGDVPFDFTAEPGDVRAVNLGAGLAD
jgi:hypothetical protein